MFGPLIAFGLGGIHVELFRDIAFRIAPLTDRDADELMRSVRGFGLLQGYRDQPPVDLPALSDLVLKVSHLGAQIPDSRTRCNPVWRSRLAAAIRSLMRARVWLLRIRARP